MTWAGEKLKRKVSVGDHDHDHDLGQGDGYGKGHGYGARVRDLKNLLLSDPLPLSVDLAATTPEDPTTI